jgi:hypothetical protein
MRRGGGRCGGIRRGRRCRWLWQKGAERSRVARRVIGACRGGGYPLRVVGGGGDAIALMGEKVAAGGMRG